MMPDVEARRQFRGEIAAHSIPIFSQRQCIIRHNKICNDPNERWFNMGVKFAVPAVLMSLILCGTASGQQASAPNAQPLRK